MCVCKRDPICLNSQRPGSFAKSAERDGKRAEEETKSHPFMRRKSEFIYGLVRIYAESCDDVSRVPPPCERPQ